MINSWVIANQISPLILTPFYLDLTERIISYLPTSPCRYDAADRQPRPQRSSAHCQTAITKVVYSTVHKLRKNRDETKCFFHLFENAKFRALYLDDIRFRKNIFILWNFFCSLKNKYFGAKITKSLQGVFTRLVPLIILRKIQHLLNSTKFLKIFTKIRIWYVFCENQI